MICQLKQTYPNKNSPNMGDKSRRIRLLKTKMIRGRRSNKQSATANPQDRLNNKNTSSKQPGYIQEVLVPVHNICL